MRTWWPLLGLVLLLAAGPAQADTGIFEGYVFLNINNGGTNTYDLNPSTQTTSYDFVGPSLGTVVQGQSLVFVGGQLKTYKNSGCNVLNAHLYYRVYSTSGGTPGSFTQVNLPFDTNLTGGDQQWSRFNNTADVAAGLAPGTYTLEVYGDSDYDQCGNGTRYYSNNSNNYQGSFTVTAPGPGPLPVELTTFEATRQGANTSLKWATASEKNNRGFEVQVSTNGQDFHALGFVAGAGSSTVAHQYQFVDAEKDKAGRRYYRLRQQDADGSATYSPVRAVAFAEVEALSAVPQPFATEVTIALRAAQAQAGALLTLTDAAGRRVLVRSLDLTAGNNQVPINDLGALPAGLYVLQVALTDQPVRLRVIKQ
ncbi:phage tail protein [Hymenobacter properus]|uniref:T9SS type A sorting domain-containing protein n=1 Tax=Hymenobacter properus TaxID=2791026 RepID=A0A931FLE5_9BACT|nr:T9SS type A sorting domain-containing protein [Hymenobacter properus]MBF9142770.1 T9SS type A sorting domain-containing protein [Hymenobacter properus]MBR7721578.1 T9SS type A sorting domain-containing protein [Microvirga sp. SRT04]